MSIPVERLLVPDTRTVPDGFAELLHPLRRGVPDELRLDAEYSLVIFVPAGNAARLRSLPVAQVVCSSDAEAAPATAPAPAGAAVLPPRQPDTVPGVPAGARWVLKRGGVFVGGGALAAGLQRRLPDGAQGTALGSAIDLQVVDYRIHAGTVCQAGDFGSYVRLAWRRIDRGTDTFELNALPPRVAQRFMAQVQSQMGVPAGPERSDV